MTSFNNPYFEHLLASSDNTDTLLSERIENDLSLLYKNDTLNKMNKDYFETESLVFEKLKEMKSTLTKKYENPKLKEYVKQVVYSETSCLLKKLSDKLLKLTETANEQSIAFPQAIEVQELLLQDKLKRVNMNKIDLKHFQNMKIKDIDSYETMNSRICVYSIVMGLFSRLQEIITEPVYEENDFGYTLTEALKQLHYCKEQVPAITFVLQKDINYYHSLPEKELSFYFKENSLHDLKYKVNDIFRFSTSVLKLCDKYYSGINRLYETVSSDKSRFRTLLERIRSSEYPEDRVSVSQAAYTRLQRLQLILAMVNTLFTTTFVKDMCLLNQILNNIILQQGNKHYV